VGSGRGSIVYAACSLPTTKGVSRVRFVVALSEPTRLSFRLLISELISAGRPASGSRVTWKVGTMVPFS
jgi:hypothetical protein